jgi:hypothetical protein
MNLGERHHLKAVGMLGCTARLCTWQIRKYFYTTSAQAKITDFYQAKSATYKLAE